MKRSALLILALAITIPSIASAFPFGGQASQVIPCYNDAIYVVLGPPIGGPFIWVNGSTKTFSFGPPTHTGQWILGLAGVPYNCVVSTAPLDVRPATAIIMMGSSR